MAKKEEERDPFESIDTLIEATTAGLQNASAQVEQASRAALLQDGALSLLNELKKRGIRLVHADGTPVDDAHDDLAR